MTPETPPAPLHPVAQAVLDFIRDHVAEHGFSPSIRELAEALDLSSTSTVHHHLKTLERRGFIRRGQNKGRAIALPREAA